MARFGLRESMDKLLRFLEETLKEILWFRATDRWPWTGAFKFWSSKELAEIQNTFPQLINSHGLQKLHDKVGWIIWMSLKTLILNKERSRVYSGSLSLKINNLWSQIIILNQLLKPYNSRLKPELVDNVHSVDSLFLSKRFSVKKNKSFSPAPSKSMVTFWRLATMLA